MRQWVKRIMLKLLSILSLAGPRKMQTFRRLGRWSWRWEQFIRAPKSDAAAYDPKRTSRKPAARAQLQQQRPRL
jgi:hypothetical protein